MTSPDIGLAPRPVDSIQGREEEEDTTMLPYRSLVLAALVLALGLAGCQTVEQARQDDVGAETGESADAGSEGAATDGDGAEEDAAASDASTDASADEASPSAGGPSSASTDDGDPGPLTGDASVFAEETRCIEALTLQPGSGLTNYWPAIGAPEHVDAAHSGVYPCATFTGSFDGPNRVFRHTSETNYGDVQFIVFDGPNTGYLMGGGLGTPSSMGQFVAKFDASTGKEIWRTYLQNANVNGQWIAFGSLGIIDDGSIIAAAGPYVWKLNRRYGDILAFNEMSVLGSPAVDANYDGFHVAPDENGTILMKTQNRPVGCPDQGNGAMASCQDEYGEQPATTVVAADSRSLEVLDAIELDEQVTARPVVTEHDGTIYMYMAGNTTLKRVSWDPDSETLEYDESWLPEYLLEGQFSGSAPAVLGDWIVSNTNVNPTTVPMSVVAVHQDDASRLVRINPWGETLPEGVQSLTLGSFGADPENDMIYAQDWFAGGVHGIRLDQDTGEMEVVWSRDDWRTSDYFSLIGPADQRVLISQFMSPDFEYSDMQGQVWEENVLWVNAATGETIAQSDYTPSTALGSLPNVGYGGRLYLMGNAGDVFIYQVMPDTDDAS